MSLLRLWSVTNSRYVSSMNANGVWCLGAAAKGNARQRKAWSVSETSLALTTLKAQSSSSHHQLNQECQPFSTLPAVSLPYVDQRLPSFSGTAAVEDAPPSALAAPTPEFQVLLPPPPQFSVLLPPAQPPAPADGYATPTANQLIGSRVGRAASPAVATPVRCFAARQEQLSTVPSVIPVVGQSASFEVLHVGYAPALAQHRSRRPRLTPQS